MTRYAAKTEVPVERTRAEIETTVTRYGADSYISGWEGRKAMVQFRCAVRYVRFNMDLPAPTEERFTTFQRGGTGFKHKRSPAASAEFWERACRQRWRALLLLVKAKLEAVESGIVTFEEEFLGHIQMPDRRTVHEHVRERVAVDYETGTMPPLLPDYSEVGR